MPLKIYDTLVGRSDAPGVLSYIDVFSKFVDGVASVNDSFEKFGTEFDRLISNVQKGYAWVVSKTKGTSTEEVRMILMTLAKLPMRVPPEMLTTPYRLGTSLTGTAPTLLSCTDVLSTEALANINMIIRFHNDEFVPAFYRSIFTLCGFDSRESAIPIIPLADLLVIMSGKRNPTDYVLGLVGAANPGKDATVAKLTAMYKDSTSASVKLGAAMGVFWKLVEPTNIMPPMYFMAVWFCGLDLRAITSIKPAITWPNPKALEDPYLPALTSIVSLMGGASKTFTLTPGGGFSFLGSLIFNNNINTVKTDVTNTNPTTTTTTGGLDDVFKFGMGEIDPKFGLSDVTNPTVNANTGDVINPGLTPITNAPFFLADAVADTCGDIAHLRSIGFDDLMIAGMIKNALDRTVRMSSSLAWYTTNVMVMAGMAYTLANMSLRGAGAIPVVSKKCSNWLVDTVTTHVASLSAATAEPDVVELLTTLNTVLYTIDGEGPMDELMSRIQGLLGSVKAFDVPISPNGWLKALTFSAPAQK